MDPGLDFEYPSETFSFGASLMFSFTSNTNSSLLYLLTDFSQD